MLALGYTLASQTLPTSVLLLKLLEMTNVHTWEIATTYPVLPASIMMLYFLFAPLLLAKVPEVDGLLPNRQRTYTSLTLNHHMPLMSILKLI